jgi:hypothetical protein
MSRESNEEIGNITCKSRGIRARLENLSDLFFRGKYRKRPMEESRVTEVD